MALHPIVKKMRAKVREVEKELKDLVKEIKQEGEDFKDDMDITVHNFLLNTTPYLQDQYDGEYIELINKYARDMRAYKTKVAKVRNKLIKAQSDLTAAERVHGKK
ncbi:hypothetical protein [Vibrio phage CAU_VPP01]|nr:hypothetical protein [Vibrio phage CAU_VPP01]